TPADAPALAQVLASNAAALPWLGASALTADSGWFADVLEAKATREPGRCVTILERSTGCVIGLAALRVPNPSDSVPWISLLVLATGRQNQGLGTEAALELEERFARAGWSEVRLGVLADNVRELRFWQRLGYGELVGVWRAYNGSRRGTIVLSKTITAPPRRLGSSKLAAAAPTANKTPGAAHATSAVGRGASERHWSRVAWPATNGRGRRR
ncbi:MAG TPA: GNAT family N-acetyltransferase, partial [Candidatus Baltobacteraceae bacterium]|nr:GNAT family N-acetyltransferase [Candidatus Baltobacteraceae bacterium]